MNIHEYQAKELLAKFGVNTPAGKVATKLEEIDKAVDSVNAKLLVVKAQIHAGGRGKGGGVKLAKSKSEAKKLAREIFGMQLVTPQTGSEGKEVQRILIEEGSDIKREIYFSLIADRDSNSLVFIASSEGGMDIEEVAIKSPEKIIKQRVDVAAGLQNFHIRRLFFGLNIPKELSKEFSSFVSACYKIFNETDSSQIEINPLVITGDGKLLALDAKMNFDDNGLFRHPEIAKLHDEAEEDPLEVEAAKAGLSYVKMNGNIGCMVNGAGLAMATMDIIKLHGAKPANFLDVGGGASKEKVATAFKLIASDPSVEGILVNIFGGIMRCDVIAEGIISAVKNLSLEIPLVIRLEGTNVELARKIFASSGLKIISAKELGEAAEAAVKAIKK